MREMKTVLATVVILLSTTAWGWAAESKDSSSGKRVGESSSVTCSASSDNDEKALKVAPTESSDSVESEKSSSKAAR